MSNTNPTKNRDELKCSGTVISCCSTCGTHRVNLVTNPVICYEWGKDWEVFTTSGTYPWSFVTQIFHNGQPSHGGDWTIFEVMTSTVPRGTLDSVVFLFAATLYQGGGPGGSMSYVVRLSNNSYKPITKMAWIRAGHCKLQKGWTRLAAACDKAYQLLVHCRWLSLGTSASCTTKTGRHDIAEILLQVALSTIDEIIKSIKKISLGSTSSGISYQLRDIYSNIAHLAPIR